MGISTGLITQKYNAVVKDYRDNAFDENNIVNIAERDDINQKLKEYKHSILS